MRCPSPVALADPAPRPCHLSQPVPAPPGWSQIAGIEPKSGKQLKVGCLPHMVSLKYPVLASLSPHSNTLKDSNPHRGLSFVQRPGPFTPIPQPVTPTARLPDCPPILPSHGKPLLQPSHLTMNSLGTPVPWEKGTESCSLVSLVAAHLNGGDSRLSSH